MLHRFLYLLLHDDDVLLAALFVPGLLIGIVILCVATVDGLRAPR